MSDPSNTNTPTRLPITSKLAYGCGAFANNLQAAASGGMMIVLVLGYGISPTLVGVINAIPRLIDAITDPLMGYISDNTKSRWGRRRPYIFCGILVSTVMFALMWQTPQEQNEMFYVAYFLGFLILFFIAYTVFATPWVALGYELTPDYHDRTTLMGVQNFMGQIPFLVIAPWFLAFMELDSFGGITNGAAFLGVGVAALCLATGVIPALFLRERYANVVSEADTLAVGSRVTDQLLSEIRKFLAGFMETIKNADFLKLACASFLVFNGFQLIAHFQSFVLIYYVYAGDADKAGILLGYFGTVSAVSTFCVIGLTTLLSRLIGKKNTFFVMIGISTIGYLSKWFFYDPEIPELILISAIFIPFGLGALFTLMPAMIADVCDADELKTGQRREGMYGSIFWWVLKLGMSLAALLGGILLDVTGFDESLQQQSEVTFQLMVIFDVFIPAATSVFAIFLVMKYSLTDENVHHIRTELENRRGVV